MLAKLASPQSMRKIQYRSSCPRKWRTIKPRPCHARIAASRRCPLPGSADLPQHRLHHSDIISRSGTSVSKLDSDSDSPRPGASAQAIKSFSSCSFAWLRPCGGGRLPPVQKPALAMCFTTHCLESRCQERQPYQQGSSSRSPSPGASYQACCSLKPFARLWRTARLL